MAVLPTHPLHSGPETGLLEGALGSSYSGHLVTNASVACCLMVALQEHLN